MCGKLFLLAHTYLPMCVYMRLSTAPQSLRQSHKPNQPPAAKTLSSTFSMICPAHSLPHARHTERLIQSMHTCLYRYLFAIFFAAFRHIRRVLPQVEKKQTKKRKYFI